MILYKYIKREHLDTFFRNGTIKIGTLYGYRSEEELGAIIGDKEEGQHITILDAPEGRKIDMGLRLPSPIFLKLLGTRLNIIGFIRFVTETKPVNI